MPSRVLSVLVERAMKAVYMNDHLYRLIYIPSSHIAYKTLYRSRVIIGTYVIGLEKGAIHY